MKKFLAILLTLTLIFSFPLQAFADSKDTEADKELEEDAERLMVLLMDAYENKNMTTEEKLVVASSVTEQLVELLVYDCDETDDEIYSDTALELVETMSDANVDCINDMNRIANYTYFAFSQATLLACEFDNGLISKEIEDLFDQISDEYKEAETFAGKAALAGAGLASQFLYLLVEVIQEEEAIEAAQKEYDILNDIEKDTEEEIFAKSLCAAANILDILNEAEPAVEYDASVSAMDMALRAFMHINVMLQLMLVG